MASTDLTSGSSVTGVTVSLALVNTLAAVLPQGTWSWHRASLTPALARSASAVMLPGLAGGSAISMTFLANVVGADAAPASVTWVMFLALADANTSAGEPEVIWVARSELAAKLKTTLTPGWAASNCWPIVVKASFSDEAASTVIVPDRAGAPEPPAPAVAAGVELDPHPASTGSASERAATATVMRRMVGSCGLSGRRSV